MTQHGIAGANPGHPLHPLRANSPADAHHHPRHDHPHPTHAPSHPPAHPAKQARRRAPRRRSSLIFWEWAVVLILMSGLGIALLALSHAPDPRKDADALVAMMKAASAGKPSDGALFGTHPVISGAGREMTVSMSRIPPKICALASWDLYRLGAIAINGVTPQRVSAARLVELCNDGETATIVWSPRSGG